MKTFWIGGAVKLQEGSGFNRGRADLLPKDARLRVRARASYVALWPT